MSRLPARFVGALLVVSVLMVSELSASGAGIATAAPAGTPCPAGTPVTGDYNGDGSPDLAVTVAANEFDNSRVFVSPARTSKGTWLAVEGNAVRSTDLNGDRCADAVVSGNPGDSVQLVLGSPSGLDAAGAIALNLPQRASFIDVGAIALRHDGVVQVVVAGCAFIPGDRFAPFLDVFTLDPAGAPGEPQVMDLSGLAVEAAPTALAAENGVLVVGFADETVTGLYGAGGVHVFTPDASDPEALVLRTSITQASAGIAGNPEKNGRFGYSLALRDGHLAIGVPRATVGKVRRTGRVQLMSWNAATSSFTPTRSLDQNTRGVVGTNETGDQFGASVALAKGLTADGSSDVVIGTPGESVGKAGGAGAFTVASLATSTSFTFTQNSVGLPGTAEKADALGSALGVLSTGVGTDTIVVGAPQETSGECTRQGYVAISGGGRLRSASRFTQLTAPRCTRYDATEFHGWGRGFGNR